MSPWTEPKRLRKQLAQTLSPVADVIYATLPYGMFRPRSDEMAMDGDICILQMRGPAFPLRLLRGRRLVQHAYGALLARRLRALVGQVDAIFCFTPDYPDLLRHLSASVKVYVANDDHSALASRPALAAAIALSERWTIEAADRILTVSGAIGERFGATGVPVDVMYPGHDTTPIALDDFVPAQRLARSACFFGYIDWRVDFALLADLLARGWAVSLIGPVVGTDAQLARLQSRFPAKLTVSPPIAPEAAARVLSQHRVLLMPYRFDTRRQAEAMELPNKVFVYLSALRPIVATDMPNLRLVEPGLVYRAGGGADFTSLCDLAGAEDSVAFAEKRRTLALENMWDSRRNFLLRLSSGGGGCA